MPCSNDSASREVERVVSEGRDTLATPGSFRIASPFLQDLSGFLSAIARPRHQDPLDIRTL